MKRLPYASVLLALTISVGAAGALWKARSTTQPLGATSRSNDTRPSAAADPLKIVLTPLGGDTKLDGQIADLQRRIAEAP
ncbi:MAG TPA: hypothetical protein VK993_13170, partial [Chthoniobacterales bacterium]|nr:hypothetical protein [Chthoniobacterales bacterium]